MGSAFEDFGKKKPMDFSIKLPGSKYQTWFPKPCDQAVLLAACQNGVKKPDGSLDIPPSPQVQQILLGLANFLKDKAQNAPDTMLNGFTITSDHLNKVDKYVPIYKTLGMKTKLPNGIGVFIDTERGNFGFVIEGTLK